MHGESRGVVFVRGATGRVNDDGGDDRVSSGTNRARHGSRVSVTQQLRQLLVFSPAMHSSAILLSLPI